MSRSSLQTERYRLQPQLPRMPLVQVPECCSLAMSRLLNTADLGQWAISSRLTNQNLKATIKERHTMLPALMILYITSYLQPQAVSRLTSTHLPMAYLLQDLMIPQGQEMFHRVGAWGVYARVAYHRPPMLLRPLRLGFHSFGPYHQRSTLKWRPFVRAHADRYQGGLEGPLSQWHKMRQLLDMAYASQRLHTLLSSSVDLPGAHLSTTFNWETELLRRLRDHNNFLSNLCHQRRTAASSASSEPDDQGSPTI
jgi:hypothetical protein